MFIVCQLLIAALIVFCVMSLPVKARRRVILAAVIGASVLVLALGATRPLNVVLFVMITGVVGHWVAPFLINRVKL
jgi:hypothetical protein